MLKINCIYSADIAVNLNTTSKVGYIPHQLRHFTINVNTKLCIISHITNINNIFFANYEVYNKIIIHMRKVGSGIRSEGFILFHTTGFPV